jgi:hypothetical protein
MPNYWENGDSEAEKVNTNYRDMHGNWAMAVMGFAGCSLLLWIFTASERYDGPSFMIWLIPLMLGVACAAATIVINRNHKRRYQQFIASGRIVPCSPELIRYTNIVVRLVHADAQAKHGWLTGQVRDLMANPGPDTDAEVARRLAQLQQGVEFPADLGRKLPTQE